MVLTQELRQRVRDEGSVLIEDEETGESYAITKVPPKTDSALQATLLLEISEIIRQSKAAFRKALPDLLANKKLRGKWVAYHGEKQVKIAKTAEEVEKACDCLGIKPNQYTLHVIDEHYEEPEEVTYPSSWFS